MLGEERVDNEHAAHVVADLVDSGPSICYRHVGSHGPPSAAGGALRAQRLVADTIALGAERERREIGAFRRVAPST